MTFRRVVVFVSVVAGVLGLSACSSDKPSGLPAFTPSASSTSSTPTPSPTSTSKWTLEQQQVIDGYDRFNNLVTAFMTKAEKVDLTKARQVAKGTVCDGISEGNRLDDLRRLCPEGKAGENGLVGSGCGGRCDPQDLRG